ncbi:MAG: sugar ABC transporter permease [Spirochaetales bacterium]|nr:sugar ABC transporter permease [Spirochaetales bacterium]
MSIAVKTLSLKQREARFGRVLIAPAVIIIAALIFYPILYQMYMSFFDVKLLDRSVFVGFENYREILTDSSFWKAVFTTAVYVFFTVAGTTLTGLGVALLMNRDFPLRGLVRSLILLPYVAPVISVVYAWKQIFDPVNGIFMHLTVEKLHLFDERFNLIGSPDSALWIAIIFSIWKNFPFTYLMILSRLQAVDTSLYEAAEIDGAGGWQKFKAITLPEVYFVMGALILLRIIWNFFKFEDIYLLADNVKVLSIYTYFKAFVGTMELGTGAALAILQFSLLVLLILFYVKRVLKW